jgi:hypothetical protein
LIDSVRFKQIKSDVHRRSLKTRHFANGIMAN